jgi:hypothetical protein
MVRWLAHRYGFGTYIHFIKGYLNEETKKESDEVRKRLINLADGLQSKVYVDTIISPSYTSAIAQGIQLPGISGKGNNVILFEYNREHLENLNQMIENFSLLKAADLDICLLQSTLRGFGYHRQIHLWITSSDYENANLIILLGYILLGHPDWSKGSISVYSIHNDDDKEQKEERLNNLIRTGRLPISHKNVQLVRQEKGADYRISVNAHSKDADITILGFNDDELLSKKGDLFEGYDDIGNVLFVNAHKELRIT